MKRKGIYPLTRLAIEMGAAARNINSQTLRNAAAASVKTIPKCRAELGGGRRGEIARAGRALLLQLADLPADQLDDAATRLRAYADAVGSRFEVTSETSLGDKRRRA